MMKGFMKFQACIPAILREVSENETEQVFYQKRLFRMEQSFWLV
jgi:hypothetical protein